jgi:hypothetical protein
MIIAHEQPFSSIEYPLFKAFINSLQPKFKIYTRNTLKADIFSMFSSMKVKLITELKEVDRVALTTDLWTSSNQSPFMVVTAHFVSPYWSLNKRIISFKELPAPHTGLAIAEQLINRIVEWKILNKVGAITVDNASSNDVSINRVRMVLNERSTSPPEMNGRYFHVRCAAHIINLVVKDGLKIVSSAVNKIRKSVRYPKSTSSRKQLFQELAINLTNTKLPALPSVDVPTRWNSTYHMMNSALPYKEVFLNQSMSDANYTHCPNSDEWDEIKTMRDFLLIFNTGKFFHFVL